MGKYQIIIKKQTNDNTGGNNILDKSRFYSFCYFLSYVSLYIHLANSF